jgi:large subunit ribosomal protein L22
MLGKTLQSAMANAENNANLNADDLVISEAIVEEGPALKRFRPCARGSAHPYKKKDEPSPHYFNRRSLIYYGTES